MHFYLPIYVVIISLISCQNQAELKTSETLKSFIDSEIVVPTNLLRKTYCNEPIDNTLLTKSYKMIVYLNANGCEECKLTTLLPLSQFIHEHSTYSSHFGVVIILHPTHMPEPDRFLEQIQYRHPVFYDLDGSFERLNPHLPQDERFHTFLLDKNNKVVVVGNPVHNEKLKKLYLKALNQYPYQ